MVNPLKNKYDIGVIVGRFQVPSLSEGHGALIDTIMDAHKQTLIIVGISQAINTKKDPLNYITRKQMIDEGYPNATVTHIMDVGNDEQWSKDLDNLVRQLHPFGSICLYGGRDSFVEVYTGVYDTFVIGDNETVGGTIIREATGKEVINSANFRAGIIYQTQNQYPKVFPTVDIAVLKKEGKEYSVLLGKRNKDIPQYRFPGGFVDPSDNSLEESALRELFEEYDVEVDNSSIKYVGSNLQQDARYNSPEERIMTSLYKVPYVFGGTVKTEFHSLCWTKVHPSGLNFIEDSHKDLFKLLLKDLKLDKT